MTLTWPSQLASRALGGAWVRRTSGGDPGRKGGYWEGPCVTHLLVGESPQGTGGPGRGAATSVLPSGWQEGEFEDTDELMYFHAVASTLKPRSPSSGGWEAALGWADRARRQTLCYRSKWNRSQEAWSLWKLL